MALVPELDFKIPPPPRRVAGEMDAMKRRAPRKKQKSGNNNPKSQTVQEKEAIKTYISEFVCGIGFTIFAEVVAAIIWSIYDRRKKEKEDERK